MTTAGGPETQSALTAAVARLLRPLVKVMLRYGMPYGAFADIARRVYIEVARSDFALPGRKQTVSRISILTGLTRKEVSRVEALDLPDDQLVSQKYNRAARVIGGWIRAPEFADEMLEPAALPMEGSENSFAALVRKYSGDVPSRAIRDELLRVGAVSVADDGKIRLEARAYIPQSTEVDKIEILGTDVADITSVIAHNLEAPPEEAFFQRKVAYDNIPSEVGDGFRRLAAEQGQALLERMSERVAPFDRDVNPSIKGSGRTRVVVGVYFRQHTVDEEEGS